MLSINGNIRIIEAEPILKKGENFWVLKMKIISRGKKFNRETKRFEDQLSYYPAKMMFYKQEDVDAWVPQMKVGQWMELKWAILQGADGKGKNFIEVCIQPNVKQTLFPKKKKENENG